MSGSVNPQISVVIPLYNKASYISRALDSVLSQTFQDFEVIVVNDGSTDGGEKIVDGYEDSRIHIIHQKNQGVSTARNNGVSVSRSELIAFLDADDEWDSTFLYEMMVLYNKYPSCGFYGSGFRRVSSDNSEDVVTNDIGDVLIQDYFRYLCEYRTTIVSASSLLVPKDILTRFGGFDSTIHWGEDRDLYCRIALFCTVAYCAQPLATIYKNTENNSNNVFYGLESQFLKRVICDGNCIKNHRDYSNIISYTDSLILHLSYRYAMAGQRSNALRYALSTKNKWHFDWIVSIIISLLPRDICELIFRFGTNRPFFIKLYHLVFK